MRVEQGKPTSEYERGRGEGIAIGVVVTSLLFAAVFAIVRGSLQ